MTCEHGRGRTADGGIRLHLRASAGDARYLITAAGPVDLPGAARLDAALRKATAPGRQVLVDISGVTFLAEAGLRVLLDAHRRLDARGGELILAGACRPVRRLLQITGSDLLLHLEPPEARRQTTRESAGRASRSRPSAVPRGV